MTIKERKMKNKRDKIKVCLIGAGRAGMIHARNFTASIPDAEIAGVSDTDGTEAQRAAAELGAAYWYEDYSEAIMKCNADAVVIATPTKYHCEIAIMAAAHGMHIFCEKPMAMNEEECERMFRAAEENGVILQVGFMRRFDAGFVKAKKMVDEGEIGDVVMIKSLTRGPSTPHEWMYDIKKSNGPLAEVNSHDIDTLRWFSGSEPERIYAVGGNFRCRDAAEQYPDFYDTVLLNIKMKNGVIGCIEGAQGVGYGYDARLEVLGTRGVIKVGSLKEDTVISCSAGSGIHSDAVKSWRNLFEQAYLEEDKFFIQCIQNGSKPAPDGRDGKMAVAVVRAGNESLNTGKVIKLVM